MVWSLQKSCTRVGHRGRDLSTRRVRASLFLSSRNFHPPLTRLCPYPTSDIKIVAVDATAATSLASKYGVSGYPTIKFFPKGKTTPEEYNGGRTADTIVSWVNSKVGTTRKVKQLPSDVLTLTSENFAENVLGERGALVEFYAPW